MVRRLTAAVHSSRRQHQSCPQILPRLAGVCQCFVRRAANGLHLHSKQTADYTAWVLQQIGASQITDRSLLQPLWSGYGELLRLRLDSASTVILKRVIPPDQDRESVSDRRKRRSYVVEQTFYREFSPRCDEHCRVAELLGALQHDGVQLLLLEDLNNAGFVPRRGAPDIRAGLSWLAHFHGRFLGTPPDGLWEQGGYWHLETRPEEWDRMPAGRLRQLAGPLDRCLRSVKYLTLMHGDSKPANFCWHPDGLAAAVDFQYVGAGCGIRDVAYFLDCCLREDACDREAESWVDFYFSVLRQAGAPSAVEEEWRPLFPVAWADYCRFWVGWARQAELGSFSVRQIERASKLV